MTRKPLLLARIALFAALIYVLSWGTSYLPNINFMFIIVFAAGFLWGMIPGILVGMIGMGLWTIFNPFGPAPVPIMLAQVLGAGGGGIVGAVFSRMNWQQWKTWRVTVYLLGAAFLCTTFFYLPVNLVDAWVFGPFRERFIGGMVWSVISLGFNFIIFPLLFKAVRYLHDRESMLS